MGADFTKPSKEAFNKPDLWDFFGRENDVKELINLVTDKSVICVHGRKLIGKSRVIKEVLMNAKLEKYKSCHLDLSSLKTNIKTKDFVNFFKKLSVELDLPVDDCAEPCSKCEWCLGNSGCLDVFECFMEEIKGVKQEYLICFDNADRIIKSKYDFFFRSFLNVIASKGKIKILVTSAVRFHMTLRTFRIYYLGPMENEDLKKLLNQILRVTLKSFNSQDPSIDDVVILCDGIPRCAELLGAILSADGGLMNPIDLVECLVRNYVETLNPDLFSEEDRPAAGYLKEINKYQELSEAYQQNWLYSIANSMEGSKILAKKGLESVQIEGEAQVTLADFKMHCVRNWIDYSVFQTCTEDGQLSINRIYKHLLSRLFSVVGKRSNDILKFGPASIKLVKEEAERIGLDLGKLENVDALKIERILYQRDLQIKRQDSGQGSGGENEADSGNSSLEDDNSDVQMKQLTFHSDKTFDQKTNLQDERIDSSSEPIAMPYYTSVDNNDRRTVNNSKLSGSKAHTKKMPSTPERTVQAKDRQCEVEGLDVRPVEKSESSPKMDHHTSGHQVCPTAPLRMSSEDYETDIKNNYVHTTEARDDRERDSPNKLERQICVRYSSSSTDSGELKLDFKTSVDER